MKVLKRFDIILLVVSIILFIIGTIMIFSSSNVSFYMRYGSSPYRYLIRQLFILLLGCGLSVAIFVFNVNFSSKVAYYANYIVFVLLLLLFVYGKVSNDAQSWFGLGEFTLQPSEFLKVTSIMYLANYFTSKKFNTKSYFKLFFPALALCIASFIAIALQPDLGTALIYAMIVLFIFLLSPVDKVIKKKLMTLLGAGVVLGCLLLFVAGKTIFTERQMSRITSVISTESPCSEEQYYTEGNQVCNGYIAINNGGMTGRGLTNSIQKYLYLPEAHTDFIYCIIVEELGLWFGLLLLVLYIILLSRIIRIGRRSLNNRDALICYGGAFYIFIHIMVNLCGILGLIPMTGVPLPFMSYGGSYTFCLIALLTVVQRINVETSAKLSHNVGNKK